MINQVHGGPVIAAWEVGQLDETWLHALNSIADLPRKQKPKQALEAKFAQYRRDHPTYRKH